MYYDEAGRIPILDTVREADALTAPKIATWGYLMPDGLPALIQATKHLVFGPAAPTDRIVTVQTLGGTGALKLGADTIARLAPGTTIALSRPTWGNHPSIFAAAGPNPRRIPLLRPRHRRRRLARHARRRRPPWPKAPPSSSTPAATTPPAPTSPPRNGRNSPPSSRTAS